MFLDWDQHFPGCEPIGHLLREAYPERWVRFHSLPGAKRHPEGETEYAEVMTRCNRILDWLTPAGVPVVLLTTGYSDSPEPTRTYPELLRLDPRAVPWRSIAMPHADGGCATPTYWHLFASRWDWRPGVFDRLFRLIADDAVANVLIVTGGGCRAVHPYDGGTDVTTATAAERDRLRATFPAWASQRADGL